MSRLRLLLYLLVLMGVWLLWQSRTHGNILKNWRREWRRLGRVLVVTLILYWILLLTWTLLR